jgi:hypothetical protein
MAVGALPLASSRRLVGSTADAGQRLDRVPMPWVQREHAHQVRASGRQLAAGGRDACQAVVPLIGENRSADEAEKLRTRLRVLTSGIEATGISMNLTGGRFGRRRRSTTWRPRCRRVHCATGWTSLLACRRNPGSGVSLTGEEVESRNR